MRIFNNDKSFFSNFASLVLSCLFAFCYLALPSPLNAQDGSLDQTFGTNGIVTTDFNSSNDLGNSIAVLSDGKIIVAGYSDNGNGNKDFAIVRYNNVGSLDNNFGNSGKVTTDLGGNSDVGHSLAIQSDGKILISGTTNSTFGLVRYNNDGTIDSSFGTNGIVLTSFDLFTEAGNSVRILPNGKILVGGYAYISANNQYDYDFAVVRYNIDGSIDNSFGTNGKLTIDFGSSDDLANEMVIQSDGKILLTGKSTEVGGSNSKIALARYTDFGTPDYTFGSVGKVTTDIDTDIDEGQSIAIQTDGKIIVAGHSDNGSNKDDFCLLRYNDDGTLDNTFGINGKVISQVGSSRDYAYDLVIQSDGKIVVVGESYNGSNYDIAIVRYKHDGSQDYTFGTNGKIMTPIGISSEFGRSVSIQSDGKILVAGGSVIGNNYDFALLRYNNPSISAFSGSDTEPITTTTGTVTKSFPNTNIGLSLDPSSTGSISVSKYENEPIAGNFTIGVGANTTINKFWSIASDVLFSNGTMSIPFSEIPSNLDPNSLIILKRENSLDDWISIGGVDDDNGNFVSTIPFNSFSEITIGYSSQSYNIKVFLEGPFTTTTMSTELDLSTQLTQPYSLPIHGGTESVNADVFTTHTDIVDWVVVELRTGTDAASKVKTRAAFLKADGSIVDLDGTSDVEFTGIDSSIPYYIVIYHRNHLPVMSASAVPLN